MLPFLLLMLTLVGVSYFAERITQLPLWIDIVAVLVIGLVIALLIERPDMLDR
jgi:uncharacterized integral membrane protein